MKKRVTDEIIPQDMSTLLAYEQFRRIRKVLKQETVMFLRDELKRIGTNN